MSIIQEALRKAQSQVKDPDASHRRGQAQAADTVMRKPEGASTGKEAVASGPQKISKPGHDPKAVAILLVLLVATACLAANQLFPKKSAAGLPAPAPVSVPKEPRSFSQNMAAPTVPDIILQKPEVKKTAQKEFVLNGIMYLEDGPRAIINDAMVETGDMVDGAVVLRINKRNVILRYNDEETTLVLK